MTVDELILHDKTRSGLNMYLNSPTHALLLTGSVGVGLGTIARTLATQIAGPQVVVIEPTIHNKQKTASINIDDIRKIYDLNGKRRHDKLAIVIDGTEFMTNDAPQAFLKLLEEPTESLFFILTAHESSNIPATITSRTQPIVVLPPSADDCRQLMDSGPLKMTNDKAKKISFIAGNRPAELIRLVNDEAYFRNSVESIEKAKLFLENGVAERLKVIVGIANRQQAIEFVKSVVKLLSIMSANTKSADLTAKRIGVAADVIDNIAQNGNLRVQLTFLALST